MLCECDVMSRSAMSYYHNAVLAVLGTFFTPKAAQPGAKVCHRFIYINRYKIVDCYLPSHLQSVSLRLLKLITI